MDTVLVLVLPYLKKTLTKEKVYYEMLYDEIIVPAILDGVHYKRAILLRNQWMIDQSDYLISMVRRNYGGAYATVKYAQRTDIKIIDLTKK